MLAVSRSMNWKLALGSASRLGRDWKIASLRGGHRYLGKTRVDRQLTDSLSACELRIASKIVASDNIGMEFQGVVQNGVVVLPPNVNLAEGTVVVVQYAQEQLPDESRPRKRVQFPLVRSKHPGSIHLTNDLIAEFLNDTEIPE